MIQSVLPRHSVLQRAAPGHAREVQILAANIDILFVVSGLDSDFNPRRLERYMILALASGAKPVFVLTKADLCGDVDEKTAIVQRIAGSHAVIVSGAQDEEGVRKMRVLLQTQTTAALIGSSGAGKSTLVNRLLGGQRQATQEVRRGDEKGRHTTTSRQMFAVPGGGWLIDQPGIREIQIGADVETVTDAFPELAALGGQCRFRDCRHLSEPGCAVRGQMDAERLQSFEKLRREVESDPRNLSPQANAERKSRTKSIHKAMRKFEKHRGPNR